MAKIIDSKGNWIAGQDTFVQTVSPVTGWQMEIGNHMPLCCMGKLNYL
jgi:hypothetical protein